MVVFQAAFAVLFIHAVHVQGLILSSRPKGVTFIDVGLSLVGHEPRVAGRGEEARSEILGGWEGTG